MKRKTEKLEKLENEMREGLVTKETVVQCS